MDTAFTARNVAKWVVKSVIAAKVTELAADAAVDYTRYEKDDLIVRLGAGAIGWGVSAKLAPITDAMVDKTADFITEQRTKRAAKKNTEKKD